MVLCFARSRQQIGTPAVYQARVLMEYTPGLIKRLLPSCLSSSSHPFGEVSLVAVTCHHARANTSKPPGNPSVEGAEGWGSMERR